MRRINLNKWWFEDDGYGIVGWSFKCRNCGKDNRFASSSDSSMACEYCREETIFTKEDIEAIENSL